MRFALIAVAVGASLFSPPARAEYAGELADPPAVEQPAPKASTGVGDKALTLGGAATAISTVLVSVAAFFNARRRRLIAEGVHFAFMFVENRGAKDGAENTKIDKAAAALKAFDEWLLAKGVRELSVQERRLAELELQAKHGEQIAAAKVAAVAGAATVTQ